MVNEKINNNNNKKESNWLAFLNIISLYSFMIIYIFISFYLFFLKNISVCIIRISFQKTFSGETFTNFKEVQKILQSRILWLQCSCHGASEDTQGSYPKRRCPGSLSQGSFIFFKMTTSKVHLQLGEQSKVQGSNIWTVARVRDIFHAHFGQHKALLHSEFQIAFMSWIHFAVSIVQ